MKPGVELHHTFDRLSYVIIAHQHTYERIPTINILFCKASRNYTEFHLINGEVKVSSHTLLYWEKALRGKGFYRPSKYYVVNDSHVKGLARSDGGYLLLDNDTKIYLTDKYRKAVYGYFKK